MWHGAPATLGAMRRLLTLFTLCASIATAAPVPIPAPAVVGPPPDWYEVELVVFRHTQPGAGASETWPVALVRPAIETARELLPPADTPAAFMALPPGASRLTTQWDRLVKSSRYEPIAYFAWLQPPFERGTAPTVRIAAPEPAAVVVEVAPVAPSTPAFAFAAEAPAEPVLPPLRMPLDGTAAVALSRYLYLTLDLAFQPGDLAPLTGELPLPPFRLTETRRMRSKELHYFDHPLFGVIALITPRPAPAVMAVN